MTTTPLTATQTQVLQHALDHTDGRIEWFPDSVKGGARQKVLDALFHRALITPSGDGWCVAAEGCDALGRPRPSSASVAPLVADPELEATVAQHEAQWAREAQQTPHELPCEVSAIASAPAPAFKTRTRENSKQATVIAMLKRPDGASIAQICEATGWRAHTVRGTFAGALKKKLGLAITSVKHQGAERVYKVV